MKKTIKIIVSGDGGVGKTSFLTRLIHDNFDMNSELTKGVDFFSKDVRINGYEYNFVMWDFAGQDQFKKLLSEKIFWCKKDISLQEISYKKMASDKFEYQSLQ